MIKIHSSRFMDLRRLSITLLCTPLFSLALYADATEKTRMWSRIGPEGANINQLVFSPSQPDILYAATSPSSYYTSSNEFILKSLNGGDSWVTLPWPGKALSIQNLVANRKHQSYSSFFHSQPWKGRTLAIDASNPDIVYTSLSGFLIKTTNSGMSWHTTGTEIDINSHSFFILNNSVNATVNALVLSDNDLASSDDSGHWQLSNTRINTQIQQTVLPSIRYLKGESNIQLIRTAPDNSNIMYGYTTLRHRSALAPLPVLLYKSTDQGNSWLNITPAGYRYIGNDLVFATDDTQQIFSIFAKTESNTFDAIIDEGLILHSVDGGENWQALSVPATGKTEYDVTGIFLDPIENNTLYANISPNAESTEEEINAIAKSVNLGKSWDIIDISPYSSGNISIDPQNNQKLLMLSKQGILRSSDGGKNWAISNKGIRHIGGKLSVAQENNLVLYLANNNLETIVNNGVSEGGYFKSSDGGQHWMRFMTSPIVTEPCQQFEINPKNAQDIFCLTAENIYQSLNGGEQWQSIKKSDSQQLVRAPDGLTIYLSDSTGTSISEDNGLSWKIISDINEGKLSLHPQKSAHLYYILDDQLYSSVDRGEHWLKLETPDNISFKHQLINPLNPEVMVLYDYYSYLLTLDGGQSWRTILATVNDGNTTIDTFPAEFNYITQLVFHPTDIKSVFVKTNTGIYQSTDQGAHWQIRNSGLENHISNSFISVNLLTSDHDVFIDSPAGIFKLTDQINFSAVAECIFSWAEQENADQFAPGDVNSQQWNGYTFRYYSQSNTFLGIFHEQEIHQLQPSKSSDIIPQDSIASYQNRSGCTDLLF